MSNWLIILLNTIILFFLTLGLTRFMKKKNLSKATPFELISYVVIAIIITVTSLGIITNIYFGLTVLAFWIIITIILNYASMKINGFITY